MNWLELLGQICELCLVPLFGLLTAWLINFLSKKSEEIKAKTKNDKIDKYIDILNNVICECVLATKQTYVDNLKKENIFDVEAQKIAFQKTYDNVMGILTDEAKNCLAEAYGDLTQFITSKIEAEVSVTK